MIWTRRITAPDEWSWRRRMVFICEKLHADLFGGTLYAPDVVGIEDVSVWRNTMTSLKMAKTIGWLTAELSSWYPDAPIYHVNGSTVAAGVEAPRKREAKSARYMTIAAQLTGRRVSEDEAAAICVGLATRTIFGGEEGEGVI